MRPRRCVSGSPMSRRCWAKSTVPAGSTSMPVSFATPRLRIISGPDGVILRCSTEMKTPSEKCSVSSGLWRPSTPRPTLTRASLPPDQPRRSRPIPCRRLSKSCRPRTSPRSGPQRSGRSSPRKDGACKAPRRSPWNSCRQTGSTGRRLGSASSLASRAWDTTRTPRAAPRSPPPRPTTRRSSWTSTWIWRICLRSRRCRPQFLAVPRQRSNPGGGLFFCFCGYGA
mmetsp:Transcript_92293/g.211252  ORF Transcript_92293/g.211252 Transcript_92293/m.211252 type:complete len:226 (-) Transcript_92293:48-725(-)